MGASARPRHDRRFRYTTNAVVAALGLVACLTSARAQELEPRAYSPSPIGTNFFVLAYSRTGGPILFDPSVPVEDVEADLSGVTLALGRTFSLCGRQALFTTALPYLWGDVEGKVNEQQRRITRSGMGDLRMKLSVSLLNGKALSLTEFAKRDRRTVIGASLTVSAPTGQYDGAKLINLGTNRWAFKPEIGVSQPLGKWDLDAYAGVWLYTANDDFFPGHLRRTTSPLFAAQGHASYTFRPGLWAAADATWYAGGAGRVNQGPPSTSLNTSRLGGTLSLPVAKGQSVKLSYSDGVTARTGTKFRLFTLAYQFTWFSR